MSGPAPSVIGLDADDTLWQNESFFADAQATFAEILAPWGGDDTLARHDATERRNLELFGYGVKGYTLSMIETALEVSDGRIGGREVSALLELGKEMLRHPVDLLPGVPETVAALADSYRLVLITKGDLNHQEQKIARSGLADRFERVEIVTEKDEATYRSILGRVGVPPESFCMVGNSVRSDVLPVVAIGGRAVHIPHEITWSHEEVDEPGPDFTTLATLRELPGWLAKL